MWERELIVDPIYQRQGIATALRERFLKKVLGMSVPVLILTRMREDNIPVLRIATKLGFSRTFILVQSSQRKDVFHEYYYKQLNAKGGKYD